MDNELILKMMDILINNKSISDEYIKNQLENYKLIIGEESYDEYLLKLENR